MILLERLSMMSLLKKLMLFRLLILVNFSTKDVEDKSPIHAVYFMTNDFNKFSDTIFDERLK